MIKNIFGKSIISIICALFLVLTMGACGKEPKEALPSVQISIWADERMIPLLQDSIKEFCEMHSDEVVLECILSEEGEDTCRDTILSDPEHAADIFSFADDQFDDLYNNGVLLEISENSDEIIRADGGSDSVVSELVVRDGKLYAYPQTSGNGYYLYYNKKYLSDNDIISMDNILKAAEDNNKKFSMEYGNGWYIYSFFKGAGLDLSINEDGSANVCNWNATDTRYKGVDVAKAMLEITKSPAFISLTDDEFVEGIQKGDIIAGINGPWNSSYIEEAWGDDYAAAKLPTYTLNGEQVQMCSFTGFKLMGINAKTANPEWCMKLADYLTSEQAQLKRFELLGECPVNVDAANSEMVKRDPAVAALNAQSKYASIQRIASPYWDAAGKFGITIAGGNSGNRDLQELLDEMVDEITGKVED